MVMEKVVPATPMFEEAMALRSARAPSARRNNPSSCPARRVVAGDVGRLQPDPELSQQDAAEDDEGRPEPEHVAEDFQPGLTRALIVATDPFRARQRPARWGVPDDRWRKDGP